MKFSISSFLSNTSIYTLILTFIIIMIIINLAAIFLTKFTKTVTINEKYVRPSIRYMKYQFSDEQGNTYQLTDSMYLLEFDSADDYAKLSIGSTYKIHGYWFRFPLLSWFPQVYKLSSI